MAQSAVLKQTIDIATQPGNQGAVGVVTFITGWSTYFELLTPIIGVIAGILGGLLTTLLIKYTIQKRREERKMATLKRESEHLAIEIKREQLRKMQDG